MLPQSFNYILSAFLNYQNFCDNEYLEFHIWPGDYLAVLILKRIVVCNNV